MQPIAAAASIEEVGCRPSPILHCLWSRRQATAEGGAGEVIEVFDPILEEIAHPAGSLRDDLLVVRSLVKPPMQRGQVDFEDKDAVEQIDNFLFDERLT